MTHTHTHTKQIVLVLFVHAWRERSEVFCLHPYIIEVNGIYFFSGNYIENLDLKAQQQHLFPESVTLDYPHDLFCLMLWAQNLVLMKLYSGLKLFVQLLIG